MAFYDGRLKNYLVLCAKRERGLNHSGGDAEGESFHIEQQVRAKFLGKVGGGGYSEFQLMGMIEWGQKSKPKKIPKASNKTKKIPGPKINPPPSKKKKALNDITRKIKTSSGWDRRALLTTNLQIVLNTQTNPYLNQATKKILAKFSYLKKIPQTKISNPQKSFDHPRHLKLGVLPLGLKVAMNHTCPSHGLGTLCRKFVRLHITSLEREKH